MSNKINRLNCEVSTISIHDGHRQRLKNRFLKYGLDSFEEHEALELLLFFALPRKDTNALAHELLARFGNLKHVFDADVSDLANIQGIGSNAALLIKLQSELARKYWIADLKKNTKLSSVAAAVEYATHIFRGKAKEEFYVISLDAHFRVKHTDSLGSGTALQTSVSIRQITEIAIRTGADHILVAHNHPGGSSTPSEQDKKITQQILTAMDAICISLLDHIIVGENSSFSFSEKLLILDQYA